MGTWRKASSVDGLMRHVELDRVISCSNFAVSDACVGCGRCVAVCADSAYSAIHLDENRKAIVDKDKCDGCGLCTQICPVGCMTMQHR